MTGKRVSGTADFDIKARLVSSKRAHFAGEVSAEMFILGRDRVQVLSKRGAKERLLLSPAATLLLIPEDDERRCGFAEENETEEGSLGPKVGVRGSRLQKGRRHRHFFSRSFRSMAPQASRVI